MKFPITPIVAAVALLLPVGGAHAATINIGDLGSQTPTLTRPTGTFSAATYYPDSEHGVNDSDDALNSQADLTIAWEMTFLDIDDSAANTRILVDLGNGSGSGLSVVWNQGSSAIRVQAEDGSSQMGGNGSGDTAALEYLLTNADVDVSKTWVVSIDVDGTSSTLNLFVDSVLIGSVSGVPITDWAVQDDGGFFANGGTGTLREAFTNAGSASPPNSEEAVADSDLRFYQDTFVQVIPAPAALPAGLAMIGLVVMRRRHQ